MSETLQCAACGGRNAAGAQWCSQCYEPLSSGWADRAATPVAPATTAGSGAVPGPPPGPPASPPPGPPPGPPPTGLPEAAVGAAAAHGLLPLPDDPVPPAAPVALEAGDGRFRRVDDGLEWSCAVCEEWNPLERTTCVVCRAAFMRADGGAETVPDVDPLLLVGATVLLPGVGHALLGQWAQAFFRALLALVWGVGGLSLLLDALAAGQPVLPAVPLLLGWLVLAGASVNDTLVAAGNPGRVLLQGRAVLWLVMGVIGVTIAAAFVGALAAVG